MRIQASKLWFVAIVLLFGTLFLASSASASTIGVGIGGFGPGSTLTTFTSLASGTEVNGLTVGGIGFSYSLGNGQVIIDGGPGPTNNIAPPNIVSVRNNTGVLTMTLPSFVDTFGYGYALLSGVPLSNATTISLFNGATPVGSLSYASTPDPFFSGGFAGIQSTIAFNIVKVTFDSADAPAFALDNIRTFSSVPEPSSILLVGSGLGALLLCCRRR
jgi:hypothetical protein